MNPVIARQIGSATPTFTVICGDHAEGRQTDA
jgi:hypothetical protein